MLEREMCWKHSGDNVRKVPLIKEKNFSLDYIHSWKLIDETAAVRVYHLDKVANQLLGLGG